MIGPAPQWAVPSQPDTTAARVLIVDDDVSVTDTFSRMLRLEGYQVWAAHSADEGLGLAQAHGPHAIILDMRMPLTSGLQFLRAIRAIPGLTNTPVAIVTGILSGRGAVVGNPALGADAVQAALLEELVTLARELLRSGPGVRTAQSRAGQISRAQNLPWMLSLIRETLKW